MRGYSPESMRLHDVVNLNCIGQIIFGIESRPTSPTARYKSKPENKASYRTCLSALPCRRSMEVDTSAAISLLVLLCRRRHCDRNEPQSHADVHRRGARPDLGLPIVLPRMVTPTRSAFRRYPRTQPLPFVNSPELTTYPRSHRPALHRTPNART